MTRIDSGVFEPGWEDRLGITPNDVQWVETGERLTAETFAEKRAGPGGTVIAHAIPPAATAAALAHPRVMVASDGIAWEGGKSHPRSAGCFSRFLGLYVREQKILELPEALRKITLFPAQRLEKMCSAMKKKGLSKKRRSIY